MKTLAILEGVPILVTTEGQETVTFTADADIDADGSGGNPYHDPYFQPDTSLHYRGQPLNSKEVPYIVVPPIVATDTRGVVLGCVAGIFNTVTKLSCKCVVADFGPSRKLGEISIAAARLIGVPWHPVTGGEERKVIRYTVFPGVAANVNGVQYVLQSLNARR